MEIPGYVTNTLIILQQTPTVSPQYYPHHHTGLKYSIPGTRKYATAPHETPIISKKDTTFVQYIVETFLYYGILIDGTIFP